MATENQKKQQKPGLESNERQMRGLEELGQNAALAIGAEKVIEQVIDVSGQQAQEISENVAEQKQQTDVLQTGEQIVAVHALQVAEATKKEVQQSTDAQAKASYENMVQQRMETEEKKKAQKKQFTVTTPKPASDVTEVAEDVLAPGNMPLLVIPMGRFLKEAIGKIV